jgi:hypothetical protein
VIRPIYNWFNRNWFTIVTWLIIANMLAVSMVLAGCKEARCPTPVPDPSPFTTLADLGSTLVWVGGISAAAGIACRVLALFYPPLAFLGGIAGFAAIGGAAVTVTGASCQWLADNPLVVLLVAAACLGAVVWWYWPRIRHALDRRLHGKIT